MIATSKDLTLKLSRCDVIRYLLNLRRAIDVVEQSRPELMTLCYALDDLRKELEAL